MSQPLDESWRDEANCRNVPPSVFYPTEAEDIGPAQAICAACDVRPDCDAFATSTHQQEGVWAGILREPRWKRVRRANACPGCGGDPGSRAMVRGERRYCSLDCVRAAERRVDL